MYYNQLKPCMHQYSFTVYLLCIYINMQLCAIINALKPQCTAHIKSHIERLVCVLFVYMQVYMTMLRSQCITVQARLKLKEQKFAFFYLLMALIQKYGEQIVYTNCHAYYMQQWPSLFNYLLAGEPIWYTNINVSLLNQYYCLQQQYIYVLFLNFE